MNYGKAAGWVLAIAVIVQCLLWGFFGYLAALVVRALLKYLGAHS